jgi:hypothetical protein
MSKRLWILDVATASLSCFLSSALSPVRQSRRPAQLLPTSTVISPEHNVSERRTVLKDFNRQKHIPHATALTRANLPRTIHEDRQAAKGTSPEQVSKKFQKVRACRPGQLCLE